MTSFIASKLSCLRGQNLIFTDLDFQLSNGEALVLSGENGSGKSSLIRVLAGLIKPFHGKLTWAGENILDDMASHFDNLIYIGHQNAIKSPLTLYENLEFWANLYGDNDNLKNNIDLALSTFDLTVIADNLGRVLSSGQRRRLNLARLLLSNRPLWILDEPTVGLDNKSCQYLENIIKKHRQSGGIVILSTHVGIDIPDHKILDLNQFSIINRNEKAS